MIFTGSQILSCGRVWNNLLTNRWDKDPVHLGYPEKKRERKNKNVIHYKHLKSSSARVFNENFTRWSKESNVAKKVAT